MYMGQRIKHLRKKLLNVSQEIFAEKINISRSNLGNIETDKVKLTDRVINDICAAYFVNKNWILSGEEPIFIDSNDALIDEIIDIYKTLNEDNKKYFKGYLHRLLEEQATLKN